MNVELKWLPVRVLTTAPLTKEQIEQARNEWDSLYNHVEDLEKRVAEAESLCKEMGERLVEMDNEV